MQPDFAEEMKHTTNIADAVAKLHLEKGDALIVDATVIDATILAKSLIGPKGTAIIAVSPLRGQTVKDAFLVMHEEELKALTKEKLKELLDAAS